MKYKTIGKKVEIVSGLDKGKRGYIVKKEHYGHKLDDFSSKSLDRYPTLIVLALVKDGIDATAYAYTVETKNNVKVVL